LGTRLAKRLFGRYDLALKEVCPNRRLGGLSMNVVVEISIGELVDKLTILEIKLDHICDPEQRGNVQREYLTLTSVIPPTVAKSPEVFELRRQIKEINARLWHIEDSIRNKERAKSFDDEFIALARSVYVTNDLRASLKRQINLCMNSNLVEEKSYQAY
jgi:hypothetical protein